MEAKVLLHDKTFSPFITEEAIQQGVKELAAKINSDYAGLNPLIIGVLSGSYMLMSDLTKQLAMPCEIGFVRVSSYQGTQSEGQIKNVIGLNTSVEGRHVLLVEDIVDTGLTAKYLLEMLDKQRPVSVKLLTLLHKPEAQKVNVKPDYIGFEIENKFVVGYGLDYNEQGRNLKAIYAED